MIDGGWCPPSENILVILIQNGTLLCNTNGYTCFDIIQEIYSRLAVMKPTGIDCTNTKRDFYSDVHTILNRNLQYGPYAHFGY